jgi:ribulose kinase
MWLRSVNENYFCCQTSLSLFCLQRVVANIDVSLVKGIGFDATCSLVAVGPRNAPVTISPTGGIICAFL